MQIWVVGKVGEDLGVVAWRGENMIRNMLYEKNLYSILTIEKTHREMFYELP